MSVSIKNIFQIISFLFIAKGVVFSLSPDSEPEWNLVEELGLFQSSDNLVAGVIICFFKLINFFIFLIKSIFLKRQDLITICDKAVEFKLCVNTVLHKLWEDVNSLQNEGEEQMKKKRSLQHRLNKNVLAKFHKNKF
jgi:hypothetical protein